MEIREVSLTRMGMDLFKIQESIDLSDEVKRRISLQVAMGLEQMHRQRLASWRYQERKRLDQLLPKRTAFGRSAAWRFDFACKNRHSSFTPLGFR